MVALCGCKGIAIFAEAVASANEVGQSFAAQVLSDLQGKGLSAARSILADLIFCYFLIKQKVKGLRGNGAEQLSLLALKYLLFPKTLTIPKTITIFK
jgi:hypothetical protein